MTKALDAEVMTFAGRVGITRACLAFGVKPRSYRYRRQVREGRLPLRTGSSDSLRAPHPSALSTAEKERMLEELCSERFCDLAPAQVYTTLLDEGTYICRTLQMYRLLEDHGLLFERRRGGHGRRGLHPVPRLEANGPNECWTWDITRLPGSTRGVFYHLYTILDIFSREVVGWTLASRESEGVARELISRTCKKEGVDPGQLTLHADRGAPMMALSMAELLHDLGVHKSHSRPRVSNDNPYSESQFKTLKYRPNYPQRFESIQHARDWCRTFFDWYSYSHYHSGIGYLRPADLHAGRHREILEHRQEVLDTAYAAHPKRFHHRPQPATPPSRVWINRPLIKSS